MTLRLAPYLLVSAFLAAAACDDGPAAHADDAATTADTDPTGADADDATGSDTSTDDDDATGDTSSPGDTDDPADAAGAADTGGSDDDAVGPEVDGTPGPDVADTSTPDAVEDTTDPTRPPNILDALGNCDGTARAPGAYPNQLLPPGAQPEGALHKLTLDDPDARCNDGTPAVLYVRRARSQAALNRWNLHLQGGAGCGSYEECEERWCGRGYYDASKMSSRWTPEAIRAVGILSASDQNTFADFNAVYFYYCTSDEWNGMGPATLTAEDGAQYSLHRNGHKILEAALRVLEDGATSDDGEEILPPLADADAVIFSGTSAGSNGAQNNADWLRGQLGEDVQLGAIFDAAISPKAEHFPDPEVAASFDALRQARFAARRAQDEVDHFLDESCAAHFADRPDELWRCDNAQWLPHNHITTPFIARMDLKDSVSIDGFLAAGFTVAEYQHAVRETLLDLAAIRTTAIEKDQIAVDPGVYGPNCGQHVGIETNVWYMQTTVSDGTEGVTMNDAVTRWIAGDTVSLVDTVQRTLSVCQSVDETH